MTKTIFVVGGVMSGVGKGVTTASIGNIFANRGFRVSMVKCEMYLNIDAGTIRPAEHGEVFVTEDGTETDQDLGNYERFTGTTTSSLNYITNGQLYQEIIRRERNLEYGGEDVEIIPDVPNEILRRIGEATSSEDAEITIVEIGGTVGEYQNLLFLEAARMQKLQNPDDVIVVMVSYLPVPPSIGEMKTKPTQHAIRELNRAGINPDFLIARAERHIDELRKAKLSTFSNIPVDNIIAAKNVSSIYEIPITFEEQGLGQKISTALNLRASKNNNSWQTLTSQIEQCDKEITIGIIGKYFKTGGESVLKDSYISVIEAIKHAAWAHNLKPTIKWISAGDFERDDADLSVLDNVDGILVPGGFGARGVEGKIRAIQYARENSIPLLGICYGMQLTLVEFARNVIGWSNAHTTEIDPETDHPVIDIIDEQKELLAKRKYGGTMRLGAYDCALQPVTTAQTLYKADMVSERHRHRWEVNNVYRKEFERNDVVFSGMNTEADLVEILEIPNHPYMIGCQFHPEFQSSPLKPHPLFSGLIQAAKNRG